jgi:hypothetical protein
VSEPAAARSQNLYCSSARYLFSATLIYTRRVSVKPMHGFVILRRHANDFWRSHFTVFMHHAARYIPFECVKLRDAVKCCPTAN